MNFGFFPTTPSFFPYEYWQYMHPEMNYAYQPQILSQYKEIHFQEPTIKKQSQEVTKQLIKVPKIPKISKRSSKKKRKPKKKQRKDASFSGKCQKQNRNYTSIVCRMFLFHLVNHTQLEKLLQTISKQYGIFMTPQNFFVTFHKLFDLKKSYIKRELVDAVCTSQICNYEFSLVFRVLFRQFLKLQIFPTVYKSTKLNKKVKAKEAKYARKAYEIFFETAKQPEIQKNISMCLNKQSSLQKEEITLKVQNVQQSSSI